MLSYISLFILFDIFVRPSYYYSINNTLFRESHLSCAPIRCSKLRILYQGTSWYFADRKVLTVAWNCLYFDWFIYGHNTLRCGLINNYNLQFCSSVVSTYQPPHEINLVAAKMLSWCGLCTAWTWSMCKEQKEPVAWGYQQNMNYMVQSTVHYFSPIFASKFWWIAFSINMRYWTLPQRGNKRTSKVLTEGIVAYTQRPLGGGISSRTHIHLDTSCISGMIKEFLGPQLWLKKEFIYKVSFSNFASDSSYCYMMSSHLSPVAPCRCIEHTWSYACLINLLSS